MPPRKEILIRSAGTEDYESFVGLLSHLGVDDPVPTFECWQKERQRETWIAERDGRVVGYCYAQLLGELGRVAQLVVGPQARRRGTGRALLVRATEAFRARGAKEWSLNVKPDNQAAIGLYQSCGLHVAYRSWALRMLWDRLEQLPCEAVTARELLPAEDGEVELQWGLSPGRLAAARKLDGRVLLGLAGQS